MLFTKEKRAKESSYDLSGTIMEFFSDRIVQYWRRICGNAADPESGGGCSFLAYNDTVCGYHDDCGNDAWTYSH